MITGLDTAKLLLTITRKTEYSIMISAIIKHLATAMEALDQYQTEDHMKGTWDLALLLRALRAFPGGDKGWG